MDMIYYGIDKIPLYKSLYGEKISKVDLDSNIDHLPILERKHIINGFPTNWMSDKLKGAINEDLIETATTSGTSGIRIQLYRKKGWWKEEYIRTYRHYDDLNDFDIEHNKKAILTTAICSNTSCYLEKLSYEDRLISNTLYLNLSMDPNNWLKTDIERMVFELNEFKPDYLDADPIYLAIFLKKMEDYKISTTLHKPKLLSLSYEMVTAYAKRFIQSRLNVPIRNFYGTTEVGYIYLEKNGQMQRCPELSRVEFVPFDAKKKLYSLIISSLKNEYMPFIRFKVGDLVRIDPDNRDAPFDYFCGREKDILISSDGDIITPGEIDCALSKLDNNIFIYQICLSSNLITFRYMTTDNDHLRESQKNYIQSEIKKIFALENNIHFKLERSIAPEASGKFSILRNI